MLYLRDESDPAFDLALEMLSCVPKEPYAALLKDLQYDFKLKHQADVRRMLGQPHVARYELLFGQVSGARSGWGVSAPRNRWREIVSICKQYINGGKDLRP